MNPPVSKLPAGSRSYNEQRADRERKTAITAERMILDTVISNIADHSLLLTFSLKTNRAMRVVATIS